MISRISFVLVELEHGIVNRVQSASGNTRPHLMLTPVPPLHTVKYIHVLTESVQPFSDNKKQLKELQVKILRIHIKCMHSN